MHSSSEHLPVHYFGTDGIRGTWGDGVINPTFARHFGCTLAKFLQQRHERPLHRVFIGRDTRASGGELVQALTAGFAAHGMYVADLGVVPTPVVAFAVARQSGDFGIAVTASHNPAADNGYKLFGAGGFKLTLEDEAEIESLLGESCGGEAGAPGPGAQGNGWGESFDGRAHYVNFIRALLHEDCLRGWKVVLDLANGATTTTAEAVFRRWGAEIVLLGNAPDGSNINDGCGSEHPERLGETVLREKARLGIAFDGDGDRVVVCGSDGRTIPGEVLLAILSEQARRAGKLRHNLLVTTVQSNCGLDASLAKQGIRAERTPVGDRNVLYRLRETGATLGGESSGHIIFPEVAPSGDGLLAAAKVLEALLSSNDEIHTLAAAHPLYPKAEDTLRVSEKRPLEDLPVFCAAKAQAESELRSLGGRILVRYSGTEPKLRFLVEGPDTETANRILRDLKAAAETELSKKPVRD